MKYLKLFILMAVAVPFFASCSDDDELNSQPCTVGFESATVEFSESASGYVNVPIAVNGHRNGPVRVTIEAAQTGDNPAIEGQHYKITDKTLNLNADTLSTGTMNVEILIVDDTDINPDRQFTLTITSAEGAEISTQQTVVTIKDNDGDIYQSIGGTWKLTATSLATGSTVTHNINLVTVGENDPDYESVITAEMSNISGNGENISWPMTYTFDEATGKGTFSFMTGPQIGEVAGYPLLWLADIGDGNWYSEVTMTAEWELTEDGRVPNTITFDPGVGLVLYADGFGGLEGLSNIVISRN